VRRSRTPAARGVVLAAGVLLAARAWAGARPIELRMPRFTVPARSDREVCTFVRVPRRRAFDVAGATVQSRGVRRDSVTHHVHVWAYTGTAPEGFPRRTVVDSPACLGLGPEDRNDRILVVSSQSPRSLTRLPEGLAYHLEPQPDRRGRRVLGFLLDVHWVNDSDRTHTAAVRVRLLPAKRKAVRRRLQPIRDAAAGAGIDVPPGEVRTVEALWAPGADPDDTSARLGGLAPPSGPVCVAVVTAVMHKRGLSFTAGVRDGAGTTPLYTALDYTDPALLRFDGAGRNPPPLFLAPGGGRALAYACVHVNGTAWQEPSTGYVASTSLRLGCEERAGEVPGAPAATTPLGAAVPCAVDADCCGGGAAPCPRPDDPSRTLTGRCVPANLVFGATTEDEVCELAGAYYDANPAAPAGRECDLTLVPPAGG
jgi:hypothetical protein